MSDLLNKAVEATEAFERREAKKNQPIKYIIAVKDTDDDGEMSITYNLSENLTAKEYRDILKKNEEELEKWLENDEDYIKLY